jgi:hypothetical protein
MNFLAPAFLAGLVAIAVPILIHLIHRERKTVIEFPSLMFLQRIPYRRCAGRRFVTCCWILRCVALALLVAAFARPFFEKKHPAVSTTGARAGDSARPLVEHGLRRPVDKARAAARKAVSGIGATDRATLILFAGDASVATEPMATSDRVIASINAAKLELEATRFAPALKLASADHRGVHAAAARGDAHLRFPEGRLGESQRDRIPARNRCHTYRSRRRRWRMAVAQVTTSRDSAGERDHTTVAARLVNTGATAKTVATTLAVGGRNAQTLRVILPARGAQQVNFAPIAVPSGATKGSVRVTPDSLTQDDVLNFTIAPDEAVSVLIIDPIGARENQSLFSRAFAIGDRPSFRVAENPSTR